jgi:hypothetical protein
MSRSRNQVTAQQPWGLSFGLASRPQAPVPLGTAITARSSITGRPSRYQDEQQRHRYMSAREPGTTPGMQIIDEQHTDILVAEAVYETLQKDPKLPLTRMANIKRATTASDNALKNRTIGLELDVNGENLGVRLGDSLYIKREPSFVNSHINALTEVNNRAWGRWNGFVIPEGCTDLRQVVQFVGLAGGNMLYNTPGTAIEHAVSGRFPSVNNGLTAWQPGDAICDMLPNVDPTIRNLEHSHEPHTPNYPASSWCSVREVFDPRTVTDFGALAINDNIKGARRGDPQAVDLGLLAPGNETKVKRLITLEQDFALRLRFSVSAIVTVALALQLSGEPSVALPQLTTADEVFNLFFQNQAPAGQLLTYDTAQSKEFITRVMAMSMAGLLEPTLQEEYNPAKLFAPQPPTANGLPSQVVRTRATLFKDPGLSIRESGSLLLQAFSIATMDNNGRRIGISTTRCAGGTNAMGSLLLC